MERFRQKKISCFLEPDIFCLLQGMSVALSPQNLPGCINFAFKQQFLSFFMIL